MVRVIEPSYQIETSIDGVAGMAICRMLENAARVCYKSEQRITGDSYIALLKQIIKSGHESVLEHASITVRFICDRGISHELVRHRIAAFSQESSRFCNYGKGQFGNQITVIRPLFFELDTPRYFEWVKAMEEASAHYFQLLVWGCSPQEARSVLPNSLKTEIICTANLREWRHILKLRTSNKAHPQMRQLMIPLLAEFQKYIPIVFDDINPTGESENDKVR